MKINILLYFAFFFICLNANAQPVTGIKFEHSSFQEALDLAKKEHKTSWFGKILDLSYAKYNNKSPIDILFFDRNNPMDLINIIKDIFLFW